MCSGQEEFPLEVVDLEPKISQDLMQYFTGERTGFVQVGPKRYIFPHKYRDEGGRIYNMAIRPTDVFVVTFPRCGTTWTQEMVWLIYNDLDYDTAKNKLLRSRYTFPEFPLFHHPKLVQELLNEEPDNKARRNMLYAMSESMVVRLAAASPASPRFIKTHLPLSVLPPTLLDTAKVVYVARDPRDVAVSYYHHNKLIRLTGYVGDFKRYWNYFQNNLIAYTPYFEHLKEAWAQRHHPNMLFLFYEDMCKDLVATLHKVSTFFNKQLTEEELEELSRHLKFENFRNNKSVNPEMNLKESGLFNEGEEGFFRRGKAGGWLDYFDDEMAAEAQEWIAANLKDTDFRFSHMTM